MACCGPPAICRKDERGFFRDWRNLVGTTGAYTSKDVRLITGSKNQRLYWLLLAAKHDLAHKFWSAISRSTVQGSLDL